MDDLLIDPIKQVGDAISTAVGSSAKVYQQRPDVLSELISSGKPTITLSVADNTPEYDLGREIDNQNIIVIVDFYAKTSKENKQLLQVVERALIAINYALGFNTDILDPDGYSHKSTQFIY